MKAQPFADPLDLLPAGEPVGVVSWGLREMTHLPLLVGREVVPLTSRAKVAGLLTWGAKSLGRRAEARAAREALPIIRLEDPFFRSVGLGKEGTPTLGLSVDREGVYYDASRPSRLEAILAGRGWETPDLIAEAAAARARVIAERLSKYNIGSDTPTGAAAGKIVLVDQVAGDRSIAGAGADHATFMRMFKRALATYPSERLVVRVHPDVVRGHAQGFMLEPAMAHGLEILGDELSPHVLFDEAAAIWTVSSQLGFEALLRGAPVVTFAMPFFAGWGLTEDRAEGQAADAARARRAAKRNIDELFAASVLLYARWIDPVRREACRFDRVIDRLVAWREIDRRRWGRPITAYGFTRWKRERSEAFLASTQTPVTFRSAHLPRLWRAPRAKEPVRVAVWGMRDRGDFEQRCRKAGHEFVRVEDGFIRSIGLGAGLLPAGSLVVDDAGLYYDAGRPSGLETLLATHTFTDPERARGEALCRCIVARGMTKYNLGGAPIDLQTPAAGRRVVLVAGQVPGDQATRLGAGEFADMLSLVTAARRHAGDAFLVYKEHPDVVAGHRRSHGREGDIARIADLMLTKGDAAALMPQIDEVHVLSSLAGFEALLRGVAVVCWGRPFYAGWGLTTDMAALPRRGRRLAMAELVAASLIHYPRYVEPLTGIPVEVEEFLDALAASPKIPPKARPWLHRAFLSARRALVRGQTGK